MLSVEFSECLLAVVIAAPPAGSTAPSQTECLLVLVPGAMLGPKDFKNLAENAQASLGV